jgi:hypothetical protein
LLALVESLHPAATAELGVDRVNLAPQVFQLGPQRTRCLLEALDLGL